MPVFACHTLANASLEIFRKTCILQSPLVRLTFTVGLKLAWFSEGPSICVLKVEGHSEEGRPD